MTTMEQKIEQLLSDLDKYARSYAFGDACGLPCYDAFAMGEMKTIVKAFVDSLKEDDNSKVFDENQLNAYRAFIEADIPDNWAKAMAKRVADDDDWQQGDLTCSDFLWSFTRWDDTEEGTDFWYSVATEVEENGVSAFSKFKCPK